MKRMAEEKIGKIREYYEQKVKQNSNCPTSSMPDAILIEKEIELISSYIKDGDKILDVGCANGYSTMKYAQKQRCYIKGIDYSDSMIKNAKEEYAKKKDKIKGKVEFATGDIRNLKGQSSQFNKVISKRCIINLPTWQLQKLALSELIRVLKKGGQLLISEASQQGWENMNKLRAEFGLERIPQPWFNLYIDEDELFGFMQENNLKKVEVISFSSTYYIGSRVVQPFVLGKHKEPRYDSQINRLFSLLPNYGDYGTQKLYRFRKDE